MTFLALALALVPTLLGLAALGYGNAKRRRTSGEVQVSPRWRTAGILACTLSGIFVLFVGGVAAFIIWIAAVGPLGWALANGIASLPRWPLERGTGAARTLAERWALGKSAWSLARRLRRSSLSGAGAGFGQSPSWANVPVGLSVVSTILCLIAVLAAWRATSGHSAVQDLSALQTTLAFDTGAAQRNAAAIPCLRSITQSTDGVQVVRDLLSERPISLSFDKAASARGAEESLQRCILANGDNSVDVSKDRRANLYTFSVDRTMASAMQRSTVALLERYELLASMLIAQERMRQPPLCRDVGILIPEDIIDIIKVFNSDQMYAKTSKLLERISSLRQVAAAMETDSYCL